MKMAMWEKFAFIRIHKTLNQQNIFYPKRPLSHQQKKLIKQITETLEEFKCYTYWYLWYLTL